MNQTVLDDPVDEEDQGYYQVSDDVPLELIRLFVGDCTGDCQISARILDTTLVGVVSYYDRNGHKVIEDRNRKKIVMCCIDCGKTKYVKEDR